MKGRVVLNNALCCALLLIPVSLQALTQEENQTTLDWLKVVAFATHQTEYTGVFVYQHGNNVTTSRITHVVDRDSEYEKLESLDGPRREIIRHHGQVWSFIDGELVQSDTQINQQKFPALLTEKLSALTENYQIEPAGTERVAGYIARIILFKPRDKSRYAHKIWVHNDSGLLLKTSVLNHQGAVVEQYAFTQLQIGGDIDRSWVRPLTDIPVHADHGQKKQYGKTLSSESFDHDNWLINHMPDGFKKVHQVIRPMRNKSHKVTQMVYSDGLSTISIFIEPAKETDGSRHQHQISHSGAVSICSNIKHQHLITVVGEVPPAVVREVSRAIDFNGQ